MCVILAAGLVGVLALYLSNGSPSSDLEAQISQKDSTISSLQTNVASLQTQISQNSNASANQISNLNDEIATLNAQLESYYNIASMNASSILYQQSLTQEANATTSVCTDTIILCRLRCRSGNSFSKYNLRRSKLQLRRIRL